MLVLTRTTNQRIEVGDDIVITIVRVGRREVRVGIDAPKDMPIVRSEIKHRNGKGSDNEG